MAETIDWPCSSRSQNIYNSPSQTGQRWQWLQLQRRQVLQHSGTLTSAFVNQITYRTSKLEGNGSSAENTQIDPYLWTWTHCIWQFNRPLVKLQWIRADFKEKSVFFSWNCFYCHFQYFIPYTNNLYLSLNICTVFWLRAKD